MPSGELDRYRAKRDFEPTTEPQGKRRRRPSPAPRLVIQQHDARRMHFNLRLEVHGVLKSWAVPRGTSTDDCEVPMADALRDPPQWLLIKRRDEGTDARRRPVRTHPESVLSGRAVKHTGPAATDEDGQ